MHTNEREMLAQLLQQMTLAEPTQKDMEADALIREACLKQPDAAHLLVQRVMLLEIALQQSQAQIVRLQGELDQVRDQTRTDSSGYFLDPNAWGNSAHTRTSLPPQTAINPAFPAPVLTPAPSPSTAAHVGAWGSGMLGSMAATAAGVVAGGLLFQGIERMRASHGANSGLMDGLGDQAATDPQGETAFNPTVGGRKNNTDLIDASSVDDFIANEIDSAG